MVNLETFFLGVVSAVFSICMFAYIVKWYDRKWDKFNNTGDGNLRV